jgi:hypothetical protein
MNCMEWVGTQVRADGETPGIDDCDIGDGATERDTGVLQGVKKTGPGVPFVVVARGVAAAECIGSDV